MDYAAQLKALPERQLTELVDNGQQPPPGIFFYGNYDPWRTPLTYTGADGSQTGKGRGLPFIEACRDAGVRAELWYAVGQEHGFFNATAWTERCIEATDGFLREIGIPPANEPPASFAHPELNFILGTDIHPWRLEYFGNEFETGDAADDANPDNDDFNNISEFALGTNPIVSNSPPSFGFDPAADALTLHFSRRSHSYSFDDPVALVELQQCSDLLSNSWQTISITSSNVVDTTAGIETLAVPVNMSTYDLRKFFRTVITITP